MFVALVGAFLDIVKGVENQQDVAQFVRGGRGHFGIVEQFDEGRDVISPKHRAEQFHRLAAVDEGRLRLAAGDRGQKTRLHISGFVDAGRNPVGNQVEQEFFFSGRRFL